MKVSQIRHAAEMYCGKVVEDDMALDVVNEALDTIGDLSDIHDEAEVVAADTVTWYELPGGTTNIVNVVDDMGDTYQKWQTRENTIKFGDAGTYSVLIKRMPDHVDSMSDEPECHVMFHRPISFYLRGYAKLATDDGNQDGHQQITRFMEEITRVAQVIRASRKR